MLTPSRKLSTRKAVVAVALEQHRLLVIRRSHLVRAPGHFCFPGGGVEPGESCEEAIVREMHEELALEVRPLGKIWSSTTLSGYELNWWRVELPSAYSIAANAAEVEWWGWCSPEEFLQLDPILPSNREFMRAMANREFDL